MSKVACLIIVLHPNFSENGWIYLSYSAYDEEENKGSTTALARLKIKKMY